MQEVSQKWLDNQNRRTTYKSYVKITLYDRNGEEIGTFENADIISFTMEQETNYLNDNLPKYEINFTLDNHTGRFDVDYPPTDDNLYNKLNARNKVVVEIGYQVSEDATDIEWIKGGTYYLSEWKISNNSLTADFTAREWLYFLTNECNVNFINTSLISSAISNVLSSNGKIKGFSDLSYSDYVVLDNTLGDYETQGSADGNAVNSLVQLLATASGCTLYFDRENRLHIENIDLSQNAQDYEISEFNSFEYPEITFDEILKLAYIDWGWFEVSPSDLSTLKDNTDYQVLPSTNEWPTGSPAITTEGEYIWTTPIALSFTGKGNVPQLTTSEANKYLIDSTTFELNGEYIPHYAISGFAVNGDVATFTITCSNNSRTFDTNAKLSLYLPYYVSFNTSSSLTISEETDGITEQIIDNFVNNDNTADLVLLQTAKYKNNRRIIECNFRADPRLDALDIINIYKKYGGVEKAMVERVKYTWSGGMFNGEVKARNIENPFNIETKIELEGITQNATYDYGTTLNVYAYVCTYINGVLSEKRLINSSDSVSTTHSSGVPSISNHKADGYITLTFSPTSYITSGYVFLTINGIESDTYNFNVEYHNETTEIELDGISNHTLFNYGATANVYVYIYTYVEGSILKEKRLMDSSDTLAYNSSDAYSLTSHKADGYVTLSFKPSSYITSGSFYLRVNDIKSDTYDFTITYSGEETEIVIDGFTSGATYDYGTQITMYVYIYTYVEKTIVKEKRLINSNDNVGMQTSGLSSVNINKANGYITFTIGTETQHTSATFDLIVNHITNTYTCKINYEETTKIELEGITQNANYYYETQLTIYVYISTYLNGVLQERRLINSSDSIGYYYTGVNFTYKSYQANGYFTMTVGGAHASYGTSAGIYVKVNGTNSSTYSYHISYNTFANASWAEINVVCSGGVASNQYSLGNSKTINGYTAYIVAFDHYYISGSSSKTASICIGMNVPSVNEHYYYNSSSSADVYWNSCYLNNNSSHNYDMTSIYNTLDSDLQNIIQEVNTYYADSVDSSSSTRSWTCELFIPSVIEIYGENNVNNSSVGNLKTYATLYNTEGYQLEAFEKLNLSSTSDTSISKYISNAKTLFRTRYLNYTSSSKYYVYSTASNVLTSVELMGSSHSLFVLFNIGVAD